MFNNYKCERCGYTTNQRSHFKKHLNRKRVCNPTQNNISIEDIWDKYGFGNGNHKVTIEVTQKSPKSNPKVTIANLFGCIFCEKKFLYKQGRCRHMKKCKKKNEIETNKN